MTISRTDPFTVSGTVNAAYDNFFRISSLTVNGINSAAFVYDNDGSMIQAGDLTLTRDPLNGRLIASSLNSVNNVWTYDVFGDPENYTLSSGSTPFYSINLERDLAGRICKKTETVAGITSVYLYTYDSVRGWLTDVMSNSVPVEHYEY